MSNKPKRRFRRNEDGRLRLVAGTMNGVEYYVGAYTGECSGCACDCGDGYPCSHGAGGCDECGYTGKRVRHFPVAFDPSETERMHAMERSAP